MLSILVESTRGRRGQGTYRANAACTPPPGQMSPIAQYHPASGPTHQNAWSTYRSQARVSDHAGYKPIACLRRGRAGSQSRVRPSSLKWSVCRRWRDESTLGKLRCQYALTLTLTHSEDVVFLEMLWERIGALGEQYLLFASRRQPSHTDRPLATATACLPNHSNVSAVPIGPLRPFGPEMVCTVNAYSSAVRRLFIFPPQLGTTLHVILIRTLLLSISICRIVMLSCNLPTHSSLACSVGVHSVYTLSGRLPRVVIVNGHMSRSPLPLLVVVPFVAEPFVSFAWLVRRRTLRSDRRSGRPSVEVITSRSRGIGWWVSARNGGQVEQDRA